MTLAAPSAVAEITELLIRYTYALDAQDVEELASCFTADARGDYGRWGGKNEGRDAILATCTGASGRLRTQHFLSNIRITLDDDGAGASSSAYLRALHVARGHLEGEVCIVYGTYVDRLSRGPDGWKIYERELVETWTDGNLNVITQVFPT
jgi:3-phenylpropionate/cinnamic acid dioxygenase small subunit